MSGKKNILLAVSVLSAVFLLAMIHCSAVNAADLENVYPDVPGATTPETTETPLPVLFKYIYNLSIILAGVIAFGVAVWGGIRYILAGPSPGKLADAKEQIWLGIAGMVIIFTSYVIVNTINPDFTKLTVFLPVDKFPDTFMPSPDNPSAIDVGLYEIPVGAIITSEYGASSFLSTSSPDIDYANVEWPSATSSTSTYDTDFQGALFGARLKRIHEVASTTVAVSKKIHGLSKELKDLVLDKCDCWRGCSTAWVCEMDVGCGCDEGYVCGEEGREEIKDMISKSKPLKDAFKAFLNPDSLVEDYYNANQSDIDDLSDDEIKDLIQMMIEVENKGGYSPKTDPLERDVGRNLLEMTALINEMKKMKRMLNPYDQEVGFLSLLTFAEATTLESNTDMGSIAGLNLRIDSYYALFSSGLEKIDEKNDPATFYSAAALPYPYGETPGPRPYNQSVPEPALLPYLDKQKLSYPKNVAFAEDIPDMEIDLDTPPSTGGVCNYIVEIPIGRALDEAIKLTQAINKEMFNIFVKGHLEIIGANMLVKAAEDLADLECADGCFQPECIQFVPPPVPAICTPPICLDNFKTLLLTAQVRIAMWFIELAAIPGTDLIVQDIETSFKKLDSQEPILTDYVCKDKEGNCRNPNGTVNESKLDKRDYTLKEKLMEVQLLLDRSRELTGQDRDKSVYEILLEDYITLGFGKHYEDLLKYIRDVDAIEKTDLQNCHVMSETIRKIEGRTYGTRLMNCRDAKLLDLIDFYNEDICSQTPYLDANYFINPKERVLRPISCYCYDEDADKNYYNKQDFPELYQDISLILPNFYADTEDLDLDALENMARQWQNVRIDINNFAGFGNNYFCCVKTYEEE